MSLSLQDVYRPSRRGPWSVSARLNSVLGTRERSILASRTCEAFYHNRCRDCDFYVADNCITYYCPDNGSFTLEVSSHKVIN